MATNYVKTMKDLEAATYGGRGGMGGNSLLKSAGIVAGLHTGHGGTETPQGTVASFGNLYNCLLYTSPSPRDRQKSRMPSSA